MTWRADLEDLSDNALLARLRPLPPDSAERAAICEVLVERYAHLVRACVRPYRASPEPATYNSPATPAGTTASDRPSSPPAIERPFMLPTA